MMRELQKSIRQPSTTRKITMCRASLAALSAANSSCTAVFCSSILLTSCTNSNSVSITVLYSQHKNWRFWDRAMAALLQTCNMMGHLSPQIEISRSYLQESQWQMSFKLGTGYQTSSCCMYKTCRCNTVRSITYACHMISHQQCSLDQQGKYDLCTLATPS